MAGAGEIRWSEPPQSYIFCGICDSHFMLCSCTGTGHGIDYIFKRLPDPPPTLTRLELMKRFASIASVSPAMRRFDAMAWHANEAPGIARSIEARQVQLRAMMDDYISTLPTSDMLNGLAAAVGGQPLQNQPTEVQSSVIANECRAALASFISGDWSTVTRIGIILIQNAFQSSDPTRYRLDDSHLKTIFQGGIACLLAILEMGYSDNCGWRLALECDRPPQGTEQPVQSATDRDYFLHNVPSNTGNTTSNLPQWGDLSKCAGCGVKRENLKKCSRCKKVAYCARECQLAHFKSHKGPCKREASK